LNIIDAVRTRRSVRTYLDRPLTPETETLIRDLVARISEVPEPEGAEVRLYYVSLAEKELKGIGKLGTYGVIKNPQGYLAGTCRNTRKDLMAFGRKMEALVLELTRMGLGTCWLAGTFNREGWKKVLPLPEDHILPGVIPLGFPAESPRLKERVMRNFTRADNRKPPEQLFFREDFDHPLVPEPGEPWALPLESVRLAPSASNKQPWRLVVSGDGRSCGLYLEETPGYNGGMGFPVQVLDMGIARCHLETALREADLPFHWEAPEDGGGTSRRGPVCMAVCILD